jgi:tetratricopeptide (TPR) repeat protein
MDYKKAINFYLKSAKIRKQHETVFYKLGVCYEKLNQNEFAIESFKKALSIIIYY